MGDLKQHIIARLQVERRRIPGHPNYWAGDDGCVWSTKSGRWRRLVATEGRDGYLAVCLYDGRGGRTRYRVHSLVCRAFHGDRDTTDGAGGRVLLVRHLDGDRHNNRPDNLAWGTYAENYQDWLVSQQEHAHYERGTTPIVMGSVCDVDDMGFLS